MDNLASFIDHTALKPFVTEEEIRQLCHEARQHRFSAVCVPPMYVSLAAKCLNNTSIGICTVICFPLGYQTTYTKMAETNDALIQKATEIDLVVNISHFKSGNYSLVSEEIEKITQVVHAHQAILKVIIETAYLNREEIRKICDICATVKVDFVKTSTGFAPLGAQIEDIKWMRECLPPTIQIKASGGIKTYEQAIALVQTGATRLGTSSGVEIIKEAIAIENRPAL